MKLAKIAYQGRIASAAVIGNRVARLSDWVVADSERTGFDLAAVDLPQLRALIHASSETLALSDVTLLPPIGPESKILCLGLNYKDHVEETLNDASANPVIFSKLTDALVGSEADVIKPRVSEYFDFEGELAILIGKGGRHIRREDAMGHVFGYTIMMDGSVRDYQKHALTTGKNFWHSGALGPWVVTADDMPPLDSLKLQTRLSGRVMQQTTTDLMICDIPAAIEYISRWTPLRAGDVIATGTPAGIGSRRNPPVWMQDGDIIEVEISGIGCLRNFVKAGI